MEVYKVRRSIFDILEEELDLEYEIETIMRLFNETRIYGFKSTEYWENRDNNFLLLAHEYIFVFQKV